jgi:hypothetical protein
MKEFAEDFEVEPTNPNILDELLDDYGIAVIGYDPHTSYKVKPQL